MRDAPCGGPGTSRAGLSGTLGLTRVLLMRDAPYGGAGTSRTGGPEEVALACGLKPASERGDWGAGVEQDAGAGPASGSKDTEPEKPRSRKLGRLSQTTKHFDDHNPRRGGRQRRPRRSRALLPLSVAAAVLVHYDLVRGLH